jgi:tetratricopeptide (TPR) repeat protein
LFALVATVAVTALAILERREEAQGIAGKFPTELTAAIPPFGATGLEPTITPAPRSANVQAQLAFDRGRSALGNTTVIGSREAAREFALAMQLDGTFLPAIVGLFDARMEEASLRKQDMARAYKANEYLLQQAEKLEPDSGSVILARAMWEPADPAERARLFEEGLRKDRSNARAMTAYSGLLDGELDRPDVARIWLERALQRDPMQLRARFRYVQRNFRAVGADIEQYTLKLLELVPNYYPAQQRIAKYRWQHHGASADAIQLIEHAIEADPENPWAPHTAVPFYLDAGDPVAAGQLADADPVVAGSTAALRAMYQGDWRSAGEAALAPGSYVFGTFESWGVTIALRDYALNADQKAPVMDLLSKKYQLPLEGEWKLLVQNFREAQLLAHLLIASGRQASGLKRLDEVIAWIDANAYYGPLHNLRTKAQALALKGDGDAALDMLEESFRQNDYTLWWYTLQHDPTWKELRDHPHFLRIAAMVREHARRESARLAQMRLEGQVPDRSARGPRATNNTVR